MGKEILVADTTGRTVYAVGRVATGDDLGKWGNITDNSLDVFAEADWEKYTIALVELGSTGLYESDFPVLFNPQRAIDIIFYAQAGASPDSTDSRISGSLFELMDIWVPTVALDV